ncbi:MAG: glycosyltransferase [Cyclobacteriaceae bacterium]|nr:glycosyltransferase [Cyclobacteriaceae bacterium]
MLLPETLKLHDHQSFEFHYIYFLPWKNQMVVELQKAGGKVTCLQASNNLSIVIHVRALIQYCKDHQIQIIHSHLPWAGFVARLVHRKTGVPVVYTEHNKQERYHVLTRWMNKLSFNWQSAAVAVSEDVSVSIKKNINPDIPVNTIENGVNVRFFQREILAGSEIRKRLGIPENGFVVGTVAVFRFQKRLKEWIEVFKKASSGDQNVYAIVVGDGPLGPELVHHKNSMGLDGRLFMPGLQTEVKPWYSAMDVFMMTSQFEGLPIAMLEAMSMECAIATTDAGGIKQVVRDGIDGKMVAVENWADLSNILKNLSNDRPQCKALGLAARSRVENAFGLDRMVLGLEDLYHHYGKPIANQKA